VQARYGKENGIWGQRVSQASGAIGTPVELLNTTVHGIHSHTVAYAPVQSPTGGRYLFAFSGFAGGAELLDKNAKSISGVSLDLGTPKGGSTHFDARFGKIAGKNSFLLVFSDDDNCRPGLTACTATKDQWSGVWGVYVDPMNPSAANTAFPISKIWNHLSAARVHKPRADYDPVRKSFFVVWREIPVLDPQNKESRSHIRANWINYYVKGGLAGTTQVPQPPVNTIVSTPTGNCVTAGASCLSAEDPDFPDAATTATGAVAVWHQKSPPNVKILGVVGQVLAAP
jgi:hypothetical protein